MFSIAITAVVILISLFPVKVKEEKHIYENKKAIIVFFIVSVLQQIIIFTLDKILGVNNSNQSNTTKMYSLIVQLSLPLTVFICYFFNIRLKKYNWDLSISFLISVITVYIVYKLFIGFFGILKGTTGSDFYISFIVSFIVRLVVNLISVGFFEEVLYRGLLISGLKGLGLKDDMSIIIQAIIFGISHTMSWGAVSWAFLLSVAAQAMMGYIFGKMYFKTKSLVPCIIFHALLDTM